jgi:hypothetical protein
MSFRCHLCGHNFTQKHNLIKHLDGKKCKSPLLNDLVSLNDLIESLHKHIETITINGDQNNVHSNNVNININITVNPINKLDVSHISPDVMRKLVEEYDKDASKLNNLLGEYLKNILCDHTRPENQPVKFIKTRPPTYRSTIQDDDGKIHDVIRGLKDTCVLLSDPVLETLKQKLKECLRHAKRDQDYDYDLYEDTFKAIRDELNKENVRKALKTVLQNDVIHDLQMKFTMNK